MHPAKEEALEYLQPWEQRALPFPKESAPFRCFSRSSWPIGVGDQICLEHMESFHITKLAWKWELAVTVIYYHSTEGWLPVRFVCRISLHRHVCPHCKIHHPKWHQLCLLRRSWISPRDSLIRQKLEPSHARRTAGWGNGAFWVPLVLWIGQDLQSPGSSIQLESILNETLWTLNIRKSAVMCAIGGAQQHRHRGNPMMLTCSKNFSMVSMGPCSFPAIVSISEETNVCESNCACS